MIHLFDRVYLETLPYLDTHCDRIVISKEYNHRQTPGEVIYQYESFESLLSNMSFYNFLQSVYFQSTIKQRKIVIYCDDISEIHAYFCKHIFLNMSSEEYVNLINLINYHRQVYKKLKPFDLEKSIKLWDIKIDSLELEKIKELNLSVSYEFLFAEYLSGCCNHEEQFLKKFHYFLIDWFSEGLSDNREMILFNLLNHKFQEQLSFSEKDFDITDKNLLKNIDTLKYYADEEIWFRDGTDKINLSGISKEKSEGLRDLIFHVYKTCEGMETNRTAFGIYKWIECATRSNFSKLELDEILDFIITNTFDTSCVPRRKFGKINFAIILYAINCKRTNQLEKLLNYRLL